MHADYLRVESCVRYASARYSVPTRLIGTNLAVVVDHGSVRIVEPATRGGRAPHTAVNIQSLRLPDAVPAAADITASVAKSRQVSAAKSP